MNLFLSAPLRILLFFLGLLAFTLPRRMELYLGPPLGRLVFASGLFKRKTVIGNLRNCFPKLDNKQIWDLARRNYEHYGLLFFEYLHFFSPVKGHYREYMARHSVVEGIANWERAHAKGKGVLFVSCHLGYWEMQAAAAALAGIPLTVVTKVLKPAWLHTLFTGRRLTTGVRPALHPGSMPAILRALRRKEAVAFMNDQYARPPMGIPVRFFGVKVATLGVVGLLAKRTGAAVIPSHSYRDSKGIAHIILEPELDLGPNRENPEAATQMLAAEVERFVRRTPEQWLWIHKRFKYVDWSDRKDP